MNEKLNDEMTKPVEPERKRGVSPRTGLLMPKGGSRQGKQNKLTKDLRAMIEGALDDAGGQSYLAAQAKENPAAFLSLLGKVLPKEIVGKDGGPIQGAFTVSVLWEKPAK